jgi:hypothetical protein
VARSLRDGRIHANMRSVTSQAGPHAQFQRGIRTRSVFLAESAAREQGRPLTLSEALSLLLLYRDDPERYDRAAARWIGRYIGNGEGVTLGDVLVASAALAALRADADHAAALCAVERLLDVRGERVNLAS